MMAQRPMRLYLDTSVYGGCFDDEFREASLRVVRLIHDGAAIALSSEAIAAELSLAPSHVQQVFEDLSPDMVEPVPMTAVADSLHEAYLAAGAVRDAAQTDALHVALATSARADAIVSWNFRDIVRLDRIQDSTGSTWRTTSA